MYRPRDASTRSNGVNEPQINVDHFYHRPVYHVVRLLTKNSELPAISTDLASAGVDVTAVEILCGEHGARILDEHGRYHGLHARIVRAFQRLGYDETTLEIYDEALRKGDLLLQVPAPPARRRQVWRCCSATTFTIWATSGRARSSSSPSSTQTDRRRRRHRAGDRTDDRRYSARPGGLYRSKHAFFNDQRAARPARQLPTVLDGRNLLRKQEVTLAVRRRPAHCLSQRRTSRHARAMT
jgi:hypothetical protein